MKWNDRVNLVGFKALRPIVEILLYDTFFLHSQVPTVGKILDLGSGSGIVGIPLAILSPEREVWTVDKSLKKIQFQRHVKRSLDLPGLHPVHGRAEALPPVDADVLVVKAFGSIRDILKMGGLHIKEGGRTFILKGTKEEETEAERFESEEVIPYTLPGSDRAYRLFIYRKTLSGEGGAR